MLQFQWNKYSKNVEKTVNYLYPPELLRQFLIGIICKKKQPGIINGFPLTIVLSTALNMYEKPTINEQCSSISATYCSSKLFFRTTEIWYNAYKQ